MAIFAWLSCLSDGKGLLSPFADAFNFGPLVDSNRSVQALIEVVLEHWPGQWKHLSESDAPQEAGFLNVNIDKSYHQLGWYPRWSFSETVKRTVLWYKSIHSGASPLASCLLDLSAYQELCSDK